MRHTSIFIISIFMLCSFVSSGQEIVADTIATASADTIPAKTERYGIRVGVDLYKIARTIYDDNYQGLEFTGDYRLTKKFYLAGEVGNENKTTDEDQINFTTKGSYFKVGFDYNTYENWLDMENLVHVGLRYGVSTFSQEINNYRIYNPNTYFGESELFSGNQKYDGLTASWIEVVVGVKVEVFSNIFVGFSARLNHIVSNKQPENFENLYIPGFNRTYDGDFGVGFNYTVSYFIPIYKSAGKSKKE